MNTAHSEDLQDPEKDRQKLQPDKAIMNLPDVEDIPGQENIHPPNLQEMADTTTSSDDEEGTAVFEEGTESERLNPGEELSENNPTSGDPRQTAGSFDETLPTEISPAGKEATEVTDEEVAALDQTASPDDENQRRARLDDKDAEGEKLNEKTDNSGEDLDVPGEELDDEDEEIGEEDEENNAYSRSDDQ
ncbi:hypothetical protein [Niabella aurantiaca]|uniref:hypothetical protein n=1 Tax=Niabella aurantiaca TaxID=379900 RepID=UPI0003689F87|nr:hypothetical protein [Niabella aurantiaca]